MDLIKPIINRFTYDYFQRRDGYHPGRYRKQLVTTQYLSEDELQAMQLKKLKDILAMAYSTNEFYRKRFEQYGFEPGDLRDFSDLKNLPILTKDDIRDELVHTFSKGFSKENTVPRRTGGSTGKPLLIYYDYEAGSAKRAAVERHNAWANLFPGDRIALVWGDTHTTLSWRARLRNALTTRPISLDTLRFEPRHIDTFIVKIRKLCPQVLFGHAHSIFRLAEHIRDHGIDDVSFKSIITTSMVLSQAERRVIEEVFQTPVYNRYGCHEVSIIASECNAHNGMHIFAEGLYVELLGENNTIPRKLVLTDLVNRAMPLIRYEIGDCGMDAKGKCQCGRGLSRLSEVSGRMADFLYTPDRIPVFGLSILDTFVIHIPGIKQLQIIQDQYDHLLFCLVRDKFFSEDTLALIKWEVRKIFGDKMQYNIQFVDKIKQTRSGKYRFSICKIRKTNPNENFGSL